MADLRESAVGPAQLACNGGNGVIRTPTRRRHAGGRLHMAQKPLCRSAWRAARGLLGWRRLRRRWAVAGQAANGRPTGGWCEACWGGGGCGAGGRWQGRQRTAARLEGGARRAGWGGCGVGGWRQGQGGPRDRPLRAKLACGDLAGGPPPTGAQSSHGREDAGRPRAARRSGGGRPHRTATGRPRALTRSLGDSGFDQ